MRYGHVDGRFEEGRGSMTHIRVQENVEVIYQFLQVDFLGIVNCGLDIYVFCSEDTYESCSVEETWCWLCIGGCSS